MNTDLAAQMQIAVNAPLLIVLVLAFALRLKSTELMDAKIVLSLIMAENKL